MAMMEQVTPDVNVAAESSNVAPEQPQQPESSSGETLNTTQQVEERPHEEAVPYARFQEVNGKLKDLQESQDWLGYQRLKEALDNDSGFADHFVKTVQGYYNQAQQQQKQQQPDPLAQYPQEIADPLRKTAILEQQVQALVYQNQVAHQSAVYQQYMGRFNEKVSSLNVPEPWKNYYQRQVETQVSRMNPNALTGYDQTLLDKAFDAVDQEAKALQRSQLSSYVAEKKNNQTPASTSASGSPGRVQPQMRTQDERVSLVAEMLKAANQ